MGNFKKISEMPGIDSVNQAGHQKKQILTVVQENCKSCKVFHRKTYFT